MTALILNSGDVRHQKGICIYLYTWNLIATKFLGQSWTRPSGKARYLILSPASSDIMLPSNILADSSFNSEFGRVGHDIIGEST